jgi:hypothetical protein
MIIMTTTSFLDRIRPAISLVGDEGLREALTSTVERHAGTLAAISATFQRFASRNWPVDVRRTFIRSWHDTHLKMLPIYGLTCRLHKLAEDAADAEVRADYLHAAIRNAATSYEDLNLEWEYSHTHTQLFEMLANAVGDGDVWRLDRHCVEEAAEFKRWIYMNMVAAPIPVGLYTNMFSEIFNHGEYGEAQEPFEGFLEHRLGLSHAEARRLGLYIRVHVDEGVEEDHFNSVVESLRAYARASGQPVDYTQAARTFDEYATRMGQVMARLDRELDAVALQAA